MKSLFGRLFGAKPPTTDASAPPARPAPAFQPANDLERLLMGAASDQGQRAGFERGILSATLFAATPGPPDGPARRVMQPGEQLPLRTVTAPDGSTVAALFTAEARVADAFGAGAGFVSATGRDLLELVEPTGAMLNPGLAYGVHWGPAGVAALLGKPQSRVLSQETKVLLGTPSQPPERLIADLRGVLAADPHIAEAWFALASWADPATQTWYLDVRTALPRETVITLLRPVLSGPIEGHPLDLIVRPPGGQSGVGIRLAGAT